MSVKTDYPDAAHLLSLIGGIFVLIGGLLFAVFGAAITFFAFGLLGLFGVLGVIWGIVLIYGAMKLRSNPEQHDTWGALIVLFSLLSWVGGMGGFVIGFLLCFVGGILAIVWRPAQPASGAGLPLGQQAPGRYCPSCGAPVAQDTKFCPHCGKQLV